MKAPRGNASTREWSEYAIAQGYDAEDIEVLNRDEIRSLVEADPNPDEDTEEPGRVDDTTTAAPESEPDKDVGDDSGASAPRNLTKFLNTNEGDDEEPVTKAPTRQAKPLPDSGNTVTVDPVEATGVCVTGAYQVSVTGGHRQVAYKGDTVKAPADVVARGVALGLLVEV